ncbi:ARM repeat-containing protein [Piedraia hortae CBS 480.64]|uniref:ARM repeat-containing protein n=1 Tax=Piedraia hortae CBS 480.64 TaxID=1314780 RepID=A0A6A7CCE8_9PEZI|nr:ARM repeat-containing protein [Piedraia hortae CBS 480.64]
MNSYAPVLSALATMSSNADRSSKGQAHQYLEQFQKSEGAWTSTFEILSSPQATDEARLFAATTLKGKIIFDFHQLPRGTLPDLRDTLLRLLKSYAGGPKPIRTSLCVSLANLAIQMLDWKDVLQTVLVALGGDSTACLFEFLHVLPEEVTQGRKINLSEDDLEQRTKELLEGNASRVLQLLVQYGQSSPEAAQNPLLIECITSWMKEAPLSLIVRSPLMDMVMNGLMADASFEAAVEALCAILRETRDVDESVEMIRELYPRVATLQPRIKQYADVEDWESFKGITRILAEAGEAWVVIIAREPAQFRPLVEAVLECCLLDKEREALSVTFNFWYELKQYITLDRYVEARMAMYDLYSRLVDVMMGHLEFPQPEGEGADLFEGDREAEDRFREFRHLMGDVLKDCCEVVGTIECLKKSYERIELWVSKYAQTDQATVPHWQELEAPLFSLRAMGRMVAPDETVMLPRLISLIVQSPDQEKVRFQAVMVLGRYTEWTAQHPETLQEQLSFIMNAFQHPSKEVVRAAALSFKFFCDDCAELLKPYMSQLLQFYDQILDSLPPAGQEEVTEGVAAVLAVQPLDQLYQYFSGCSQSVVRRLISMAEQATDKDQKLAIADRLNLIAILVERVCPYVPPMQEHPLVKYCQEIFPILSAILKRFVTFEPIAERVCSCWRQMVLCYRDHMAPLLPDLAQTLGAGFTESKQGCFLWATDSIVREFSGEDGAGDGSTSQAVYGFYEAQATTFLRALNDLAPDQLPDVIEDFFRLSVDALLYHASRLLSSSLMPSILSAASISLTLLKVEPVISTLHFLRDVLAYGGEDCPSSSLTRSQQERTRNPPEIRAAVKQLTLTAGETLVQRCLTGMMYTLPEECIPDASGVMLALLELLPVETLTWTQTCISMLPAGSVAPQEQERLMQGLRQQIQEGQMNKVRPLLREFTNSYRRRNVAPREGLGRLEASKFTFAG